MALTTGRRAWTDSRLPVLIAAVGLWLWPIGIGGAMPVGGDVTQFFLGPMSFLSKSLRQGRIPLWNDLWGFGFPGVGESQMGVFYPPHWFLYGLLPVEAGLYRQPGLHSSGARWEPISPRAVRSLAPGRGVERSRGRRAVSLTFINLTNGDIPPEVGCLGRGVWRGRSRGEGTPARRSRSRWCSLSRSCRDIFSSRSSRKSALSRWQSPADKLAAALGVRIDARWGRSRGGLRRCGRRFGWHDLRRVVATSNISRGSRKRRCILSRSSRPDCSVVHRSGGRLSGTPSTPRRRRRSATSV